MHECIYKIKVNSIYVCVSTESSYLFELADKLRKQIDDGDKRTYS